MQKEVFNKVIVGMVLLLLLTACSTDKNEERSNASIDEKEDLNDYEIFFKNTSEMEDLPWADNFSFDVIQIQDMYEEILPLESTVNANIKKAMTAWINQIALNAAEVNVTITCHSPRYLSFYNFFRYKKGEFKDCITIDMLTGQRVFLNDLAEINEEFVSFLQENTDKVKEAPHPYWQTIDLNDLAPLELLVELYKCSYIKDHWEQEGGYSIDDSEVSSIFNNSFFFT